MQAQSKKKAASATQGAKLRKPLLARVFITQLVFLLVISGLLRFYGSVEAYSALVGGLISIGPNVYFARWAFKYSGARAASLVAGSFYRGEAGKFILTVVMFAAVFAWLRPLDPLVLFLAYVFMMALNWMLALRLLKR